MANAEDGDWDTYASSSTNDNGICVDYEIQNQNYVPETLKLKAKLFRTTGEWGDFGIWCYNFSSSDYTDRSIWRARREGFGPAIAEISIPLDCQNGTHVLLNADSANRESRWYEASFSYDLENELIIINDIGEVALDGSNPNDGDDITTTGWSYYHSPHGSHYGRYDTSSAYEGSLGIQLMGQGIWIKSPSFNTNVGTASVKTRMIATDSGAPTSNYVSTLALLAPDWYSYLDMNNSCRL